MTIRSKSGDWRTGAEIVGKYANTATAASETWIGDGALTCAYCADKTSVTFIGFRFIGGATYKDDEYQRGGGVNGATLQNCLVANCAAGNYGGGMYDCYSYDSTITNCHVFAGGSAYQLGGGAYNGTHNNDYFLDCHAAGSGGALNANAYDCVIENCKAGYAGGIRGSGSRCTFIGCSSNNGGGAGYQATLYNCVFSGPLTGGNFYNCLIRGANSQTYPTVFCDSSLATYKGGTVPLHLYNCTVVNNVSTYSKSGNVAGGYVNAYNTIIRDNTATKDKVDELATAVNCCLSDTATATTETDCIREDPALHLGTGDYFYPTASSPCRRAGSLTAYELTPTDLAGQPRTSNGGTTVAIGACEFDPTFVGASIVCLPETTKAPATGKFTVTYSGLGENLTFSWDFNGDGTIDLVTNVATVAYYYPEAGDYRAKSAARTPRVRTALGKPVAERVLFAVFRVMARTTPRGLSASVSSVAPRPRRARSRAAEPTTSFSRTASYPVAGHMPAAAALMMSWHTTASFRIARCTGRPLSTGRPRTVRPFTTARS